MFLGKISSTVQIASTDSACVLKKNIGKKLFGWQAIMLPVNMLFPVCTAGSLNLMST